MDYYLAVSKIYEGADFNPACFNFTEEIAREKKLWRDARPMPTPGQITAAMDEASAELAAVEYKDLRKKEYENQGLSFDSFVEMLIEGDNVGMEQYRAKRDNVKATYPKQG